MIKYKVTAIEEKSFTVQFTSEEHNLVKTLSFNKPVKSISSKKELDAFLLPTISAILQEQIITTTDHSFLEGILGKEKTINIVNSSVNNIQLN